MAAISAIATTQTRDYALARPGVSATSGVALDHGFQIGYYTILGLLLVGIAVTVVVLRPTPGRPVAEPVQDAAEVEVEQAA